jgi:hypothetical protein
MTFLRMSQMAKLMVWDRALDSDTQAQDDIAATFVLASGDDYSTIRSFIQNDATIETNFAR